MKLEYKHEKWVEILQDKKPENYPINYAISNYGRVKRFSDNIQEGKIFDASLNQKYPYWASSIKGKRVAFYIHAMVAKIFLPPPTDPAKKFIIHLDYDKCNNHFSNLQWATEEEVHKHAKNSPAKLENRHIGQKLTSTEVIRIKKMLKDPKRKTRMKMIAKQFKISEMQLYRIKVGENWAHVKVD